MEICAVFDLDGVLVDTRRAVMLAYTEAGVDMPLDAWGKPWQSWLIDACDHDPDRATEVHDRKNQVYPSFLERYAEPLPLAHYLNDIQRRGFPVFVITGASLDGAAAAMKRAKLDVSILYDYELSTQQKTGTLRQLDRDFYDGGVYYDDQDGVKVPDDWAFLKVRY